MVLSDTSRLSSIIAVALSEKNHIISRITFSKVEIEIKILDKKIYYLRYFSLCIVDQRLLNK